MPVLYRYRDLRGAGTTSPPLEPLSGGRLAKRDRVLSAFNTVDRQLSNGRRVLGRVGLHCSEKMGVGSVDPSSGYTQVYPTRTQERVALRVKYQPTPGSFPVLSAIVLPSGMTQKLAGDGTWGADIPFGQLKVTATFRAAGLTTVAWFVPLPVSGETWGGEKQEAGAAWASMSTVDIPLMAPANIKDPATLRLWSECDTVEITVAYMGGCRVIDCCLQERPWGYARDMIADTTLSSTLTTDASGQSVGTYVSEYPIDERNGIDPSYGSDNLMNVVDRQAKRRGPILAQWTSWDERTQSISASEATSVSTSSTSFVNMVSSLAPTTWDADAPGWSLSSGGQAQDFRSSSALRETRDNNAVVSCRVWLYAWRTGAGTATVRAMSADHSVGETTITSASPDWVSFTCYLRCGLGAEDASSLVLLGKNSVGTDTLHIRQMLVEQIEL